MSNIEQTETLDYYQQINENKDQTNINIYLLEGTIFGLLKTYPEVFKYNEYYTIKDGYCQCIFEHGLMIGKGAYGCVYQVLNPYNNQPAALKVQKNCKFEDVMYLAEEFKIQKKIEKLYPECIILIQNKICINQTKNNNYEIYAYLDLGLGNLREYQSKLKKFTDQQFTNLFECILDGIIKIHSLKIAHGDIKLGNIINTEKKGWVLADFGCAIQYQTFYGNYPIVGTKAYMQKEIRNALNKNQKNFKMNLFKKDIYAFQLALLQILYPNDNISNLQQILDLQILVHPNIDSLYNKDYQTIKNQFQQIKFIRISLIQESIIETESLQSDLMLHLYKFKNFPFTQKRGYFYLQMSKTLEGDYLQGDVYFRQQFIKKFSGNYDLEITCQEIFEQISFQDLKKLEYDLYYDVFEKKGQKLFQLMLCQRYQDVQKGINCNLQLQEAELLYIFDEWDQAKKIINSIDNLQNFESHELLLKYLCLKSRLNDQWSQKSQELIPYLINYKDPFYILNEWKFILMDSMWENRQKGYLNMIYINQEHVKDFELNLEQFLQYYWMRCVDMCYIGTYKINQSKLPSIINSMKEMNYDNYTIFYWCWEICIIDHYKDPYQDFIQEFIEFIEQNMGNYYFNWIIYDLYAQFLIHKKEYDLAKDYLQKAYQIIQNDCINNKFTVLSHLFQLQFKKDDSEYQDTYIKAINLLNQMSDPQTVKILFRSISQGLNYEPNIQYRLIDLNNYIDRSLEGQHPENKIQKFIYYYKEKFKTLKLFFYTNANKFLFEFLHYQLTVADDQNQDQQLLNLQQFCQSDLQDDESKDKIRLFSNQIQYLRISYYLKFNKQNSYQQIIDPTLQLFDYQQQFIEKTIYQFYQTNKGWLGDFIQLPE